MEKKVPRAKRPRHERTEDAVTLTFQDVMNKLETVAEVRRLREKIVEKKRRLEAEDKEAREHLVKESEGGCAMKDMEEKIAELNKEKEEMEEKLEKEKGEITQELELLKKLKEEQEQKAEEFKLKLEETLEEECKCPTCRDVFICPVSLNCGHTICKLSLEKWKNSSDTCTCPECRVVIMNENRVFAMEHMIDGIIGQLGEDKVKERQENVKQRTEEEDAFNATRDAFNAASESDSEVGDEAPGGSGRCLLQ